MTTTNYEWAAPKPKPTNMVIPSDSYLARCGKCGGNGKYVMAVINGQPWSATGTQCFGCGGAGWVVKRKPAKKATCPICGIRQPLDENGDIVTHGYIEQVGDSFEMVMCQHKERR